MAELASERHDQSQASRAFSGITRGFLLRRKEPPFPSRAMLRRRFIAYNGSMLPEHPPATSEQRRDRVIFYPVALTGFLFCLTVFIAIACLFGDPQVPLKQWINRHITLILVVETAVLVTIGFLSMAIDRVRTLKRLQQPPSDHHAQPDDAGSSGGTEA